MNVHGRLFHPGVTGDVEQRFLGNRATAVSISCGNRPFSPKCLNILSSSYREPVADQPDQCGTVPGRRAPAADQRDLRISPIT